MLAPRKRPGPLWIALGVSIALHLAALPLVRAFPAAHAAPLPTIPPFMITPPPRTPAPTPVPPHVAHAHAGNAQPGPHVAATEQPLSDPGPATAEPGTPLPVQTLEPIVSTAPPVPACAQPEREARVVSAVTPERPALAAQMGAFGTVDVRVTLAADGSVIATSIEHSSGLEGLDRAARDAAARARYAPALESCAPVGGSYLYRVDFSE